MTANGYDEELAAVEEGLAENLRLGYIEVAGVDADGQTTYRMTETGIQHVEQLNGAEPELWAVHVQGPDDILAAADRDDADRLAKEINEAAEFARAQSDARPELLPHVHAVVVPWDGTAAEHAEALDRQDEESERR